MKNICILKFFLSDLNNLLNASDVVIHESRGIKQKSGNSRNGTGNKDHWSRRRLEKCIKEWRKDVSNLEEVKKGKIDWAW